MQIVIKRPEGDVISEDIENRLALSEAAAMEDEFFEGAYPFGAEGQACREFELGSVDGVPEFKTEMEKQCKRVAGVKVCWRVPVVSIRTSKLTLFARVCVPSATTDEAWKIIRECALTAIAAGGITGIVTNPAAAIPAAEQAMILCLKGKSLAKIAKELELGLFTRQVAGEWQRRT